MLQANTTLPYRLWECVLWRMGWNAVDHTNDPCSPTNIGKWDIYGPINIAGGTNPRHRRSSSNPNGTKVVSIWLTSPYLESTFHSFSRPEHRGSWTVRWRQRSGLGWHKHRYQNLSRCHQGKSQRRTFLDRGAGYSSHAPVPTNCRFNKTMAALMWHVFVGITSSKTTSLFSHGQPVYRTSQRLDTFGTFLVGVWRRDNHR